jgi:hypothetical protein
MDESPILAGRECGSCTLCCKLLRIEELAKPQGEWCEHCAVGTGCRIYDERPQACRGFFCAWMTQAALDERWYPARAKLMVFPSADGRRMNIVVDPARPGAWREEPFRSEILMWAREGAARDVEVLVVVGSKVLKILPDGGEIPVGEDRS